MQSKLHFSKSAADAKWVYADPLNSTMLALARFRHRQGDLWRQHADYWRTCERGAQLLQQLQMRLCARPELIQCFLASCHQGLVTPIVNANVIIQSCRTRSILSSHPDFVALEEDPSVAGKIGEINDLDGLEAYAQASVYYYYKKNAVKKRPAPGRSATKSAGEKNDASKAIAIDPTKIVIGKATVAPSSGENSADEDSIEQMNSLSESSEEESERDGGEEALAKKEPGKAKAISFANYEPIGVWIANWSQLFPWLVSGHSNEVPKSAQAADMIRLRVLQQDFLTLAKLYYRFSSNPNIDSPNAQNFRVPRWTGIKLEAIANAFSNGAASISAFIAKNLTAGTLGGTSDVKAQINEQLQALDSDSRKIYDAWDTIGLLRGAELGLGITLELGPPGAKDVQRLSFESFSQQTPNLEPCPFSGKDFTIFAECIKGWPLIYVDPHSQETRMVCYVEGPLAENCGILAQDPQFAAAITISTFGTAYRTTPRVAAGARFVLSVRPKLRLVRRRRRLP